MALQCLHGGGGRGVDPFARPSSRLGCSHAALAPQCHGLAQRCPSRILSSARRGPRQAQLHRTGLWPLEYQKRSECEDSFDYALFVYFTDSFFFQAGSQMTEPRRQLLPPKTTTTPTELTTTWRLPPTSSRIGGS